MTLQEALDVVLAELNLSMDSGESIGSIATLREAAALLERAKPFLAAAMEKCAAWENADLRPTDLDPFSAELFRAHRTLVEPAEGEKE